MIQFAQVDMSVGAFFAFVRAAALPNLAPVEFAGIHSEVDVTNLRRMSQLYFAGMGAPPLYRDVKQLCTIDILIGVESVNIGHRCNSGLVDLRAGFPP